MDDILHPTPDNPAPDNVTAGHFTGHRGVKLRYAICRSEISPARGTVVLLHGRNEFIERYFETIRHLNAMGLWVATFDLPGQGGSGPILTNLPTGHVRRFRAYNRALSTFLARTAPPD